MLVNMRTDFQLKIGFHMQNDTFEIRSHIALLLF